MSTMVEQIQSGIEEQVLAPPYTQLRRLFLPVLGAGFALILYPMVTWILRIQPEANSLYLLLAALIGLLVAFAWERPQVTPFPYEVAGWCLLVLFLIGALLSWMGWKQGTLIGISLALAVLSVSLVWYPATSHARFSLAAILCLMPPFFETSLWNGFREFVFHMTARFTSAILDGLQIPNERAAQLITTTGGSMDTSTFADGVTGLEVSSVVALAYLLLRRSSFAVSALTMLTMVAIWASLRSAYWGLVGYGFEFQAIEAESLARWAWFGIAAGFVSLPLIELFFSSLLAPIPKDAVATEFPFFVELFNHVLAFPQSGLIPVPESESTEFAPGEDDDE